MAKVGRKPIYFSEEEKREARRRNLQNHAQTAAFKATQDRYKYSPEGRRKKRSAQLKCCFGITLEQWEEMFERQGKKCKACGTREPKHKRGWATDHCHKTDVIRGIVCQHCNIIAGMARDDPEVLEAVANYLRLASTTT